MKKIILLFSFGLTIMSCKAQSFGVQVDSLPIVTGGASAVRDSDRIIIDKHDSIGSSATVARRTCTVNATDLKAYCKVVDTTKSVLPLFTSTQRNVDSNSLGRISVLGSIGVGSTTLPANFFSLGRAIKIDLYGYVNGNGASSDTLILMLGNTILTKVIFINAPNSKNGFNLDLVLTCWSAGSSGIIMPQLAGSFLTSAIHATTNPITINTTIVNILDVKNSFSVASAQNFCVGNTSLIYIVH